MAISTKPLDELIAQYEERIARARKKLDDLQSELRGLITARESLAPSSQRRPEANRQRGLSPTWKRILKFIEQKSATGANLDDIQEFIELHSFGIQRTAVRSQLSIYSAKGLVEPKGGGIYQVTQEGIAQLSSDDD